MPVRLSNMLSNFPRSRVYALVTKAYGTPETARVQHLNVPSAHTADVNDCACVIFLYRTTNSSQRLPLTGSVRFLQHTLSVPALPHD